MKKRNPINCKYNIANINFSVFHSRKGLNNTFNNLQELSGWCYNKGLQKKKYGACMIQNQVGKKNGAAFIGSVKIGRASLTRYDIFSSGNVDFKGRRPWIGTQQLCVFWSALSLSSYIIPYSLFSSCQSSVFMCWSGQEKKRGFSFSSRWIVRALNVSPKGRL